MTHKKRSHLKEFKTWLNRTQKNNNTVTDSDIIAYLNHVKNTNTDFADDTPSIVLSLQLHYRKNGHSRTTNPVSKPKVHAWMRRFNYDVLNKTPLTEQDRQTGSLRLYTTWMEQRRLNPEKPQKDTLIAFFNEIDTQLPFTADRLRALTKHMHEYFRRKGYFAHTSPLKIPEVQSCLQSLYERYNLPFTERFQHSLTERNILISSLSALKKIPESGIVNLRYQDITFDDQKRCTITYSAYGTTSHFTLLPNKYSTLITALRRWMRTETHPEHPLFSLHKKPNHFMTRQRLNDISKNHPPRLLQGSTH